MCLSPGLQLVSRSEPSVGRCPVLLQYWQVITVSYVTSSLLADGLLYIGLIKAPSLSLAEPLVPPSVAAAVIGGIFGGRGPTPVPAP